MKTGHHILGGGLAYNRADSEAGASSQGVSKKRVLSVKYWLPLGWLFLIFYLSSQSWIADVDPPFAYFDKVAHVGEYGILCLLLYWAFTHTPGSLWKRYPVMLSILFTVLYGCSDEIHQIFVPMRTADMADVLANSLGAGLSHLWLISIRSFKLRGKHSVTEIIGNG
jgi:hypothetical protein